MLVAYFLQLLERYNIEYNFPVFINQEELPSYYAQAKLFLFPTRNDPWVQWLTVCPLLLVVMMVLRMIWLSMVLMDILPLSQKEWAGKIIEIFNCLDEYKRFSDNALK